MGTHILRVVIALGLAWTAGAVLNQAFAASVAPNAALEKVFQRLSASATTGKYKQVADAVKASPHLTEQLNTLASSGKLTEIVVLTPATAAAAPKPGPFSAWTQGTTILFTETLLDQLTRNREFDVVRPDDVLPNNTTFVLAHLAYHLNTPIPSAKAVGVDAYVAAMLDTEARAYIQSWNDTLDAAAQQNGARLTPQQIATLMLNLRYRFAFYKALNHPTDKIRIEMSGVIEENDGNARAIVTALKTSSVADIQ